MSTTAIVVILIIAVAVILVLRSRGESRPQNPLAEYHSIQPGAAPKPDVHHIAQLLLQGKKVEAIKAYMELAGVGLEDAKEAVERYDPLRKRFATAPSPPTFDSVKDWSEIDALLEQGDKIGAIKLYRQRTGCDLKEAKDAIDIRDNPS